MARTSRQTMQLFYSGLSSCLCLAPFPILIDIEWSWTVYQPGCDSWICQPAYNFLLLITAACSSSTRTVHDLYMKLVICELTDVTVIAGTDLCDVRAVTSLTTSQSPQHNNRSCDNWRQWYWTTSVATWSANFVCQPNRHPHAGRSTQRWCHSYLPTSTARIMMTSSQYVLTITICRHIISEVFFSVRFFTNEWLWRVKTEKLHWSLRSDSDDTQPGWPEISVKSRIVLKLRYLCIIIQNMASKC